ncbi:NADP-dependent oxidoreductase domain-containing protein [Desarmillaria tabescens]|uniref:NADP-dependent oxidoreductase domain-containing protein n=1 Tax=Armillaria tabescens TaxID=1929756 RepID=A0AA39MX30_ARMTA|nr:NADP-dependent oxidoreductase domain-containing protein [Desarmillaria tabescens]KAK0449015.1 NADP-dependent oxidoreductase domain-containing protein [Desarmillaria tabescens]
MWDYETSIPEVMDSLHNLVAARRVLYLGISDTPAWVVSQANQYAMDQGKKPFIIYQGKWSILERSFEREITPMAESLGMALSPWVFLGQGRLRTDAEEQRGREGTYDEGPGLKTHRGGGTNVTAVAIAYVMQKAPYVFSIIGGRKVEHLQADLAALDISLSKDQIEYLETVIPFDPGFPTTMIGDGTSHKIFLALTAKMAKQPTGQAYHALTECDSDSNELPVFCSLTFKRYMLTHLAY